MASTDADRSPEDVPPADPPAADIAATGGPTTPRWWSPARIWGLALVAGLFAGIASWLIGESVYDRFKPALLSTGGIPSIEQVQAAARARSAALTKEVTLSFVALGAALGLALGLAGGSARGSARSAAIAGGIGTILGAAAGALMVQILLPVYFRIYHPDRDDLLLSLCIQGGICGVIGAAGGAAFGIGLDGRRLALRTLQGGLLGAVLGVLVYQMVGVLVFPLEGTTKPLSETSVTRLLSRLAVTIFSSAGAAKMALQPPRPKSG